MARLLASPNLSLALTATTYRGRVLGYSRMVDLPNRVLWLVTGNNLDMSGEIAGRTLTVRLDAGVPYPGRRAEFRHHHLLRWVQANRPRLVGALLVLVQEWVDAGMLEDPSPTAVLGGFEDYVAVIGGILHHHGVTGFLGDRDRLDQQVDREATEWLVACDRWWSAFGDAPVTAGLLLPILKGRSDREEAPLLVEGWNGRGSLSNVQRLGHFLHRHRDRRYGRYTVLQLSERDGHSGAQRFRLIVGGRDKTPQTPQTPRVTSGSPTSDAGFAGFAGFGGHRREGGDRDAADPGAAPAPPERQPESVGAEPPQWEGEP